MRRIEIFIIKKMSQDGQVIMIFKVILTTIRPYNPLMIYAKSSGTVLTSSPHFIR